MEGRKWRTAYSDPANTNRVGLDDAVWPGVFERMEQFIRDVNLTPDVPELDYDPVIQMYANGEAAMIGGSSARVQEFLNQGIDTVPLPYFGQDGEQWLMTTPYLQVALNRDLEKDEARREKTMRVLTSRKEYSNIFRSEGGNEAYSVMAGTLQGLYGSDVLIATGNSFTGSVLQADYTL